MTVSRGKAAIALRYALAPACIGAAALLHVSPVGPLFHPMGLFIIGVLAAAWFGGAGPGVFAAFLSAISLPHLIAITYPLSVSYPLLAGFFDLPRFITLGLTGAAVGWGRTSYRRAESALRERKRAEEAQRESQQRYERVLGGAEVGDWEWDVINGDYFVSARMREMLEMPPDLLFASRDEFLAHVPFHPDDREFYLEDTKRKIAIAPPGMEYEYRVVLKGDAVRWMRMRGRPTRNAHGLVTHVSGSLADITDAKLAEEALRESQERYALAVAGSDDGVWDCDFAARRIFVSARARELAGLPPGPEVVPMDEYFATLPLHPEDVPRRIAAMQAHLAGKAPAYEGEFRLRQLDGVYRWRRLHGLCLRDANGNPHRMAGSISDVDARRRAEDALRLSEQRYAVALEVAEEGNWDWNVQTDEIFASPQSLRVLGIPQDAEYRTRGEALAHARLHPDDGPRISSEWRAALAGRDVEHEFEYRILRDEEPRWIRSRWKIFRDDTGVALRVIGVVADITARKLAEEALRASEERYSLAMDASEEGHFDINLDTDELFTSERFNEIHGFAPGTRFGTRTAYLKQLRFYGNDADTFYAAARATLAKDAPERYEFEYRILRPSGEVRWVKMRGKVTRDAEGRARRRAGVVADITDAKLAEEALRRSEQRYALAMEAAQDAYWDWNMVTGEYYISPRSSQLYGFPEGTKIATHADFLAISPILPEDGEAWARASADLFAGAGDRLSMELRANVREEMRWMQFNSVCIRDPDGKPIRWCGCVRDVTDRKRAEAALRLSEERYALAMEAAAEGHFDTDFETDETFVSARLAEIYGFPRHARIANRMEWIQQIPVHPDDRRVLADLLRRDWEDTTRSFYDFEYRIVPRPGETRWIHTRGKVTRDAQGRPRRRVGVVADITARKLAEEAQRQSEERYALAVAGSNEGIFDWDLVSDRVYVSYRAQELFGLPRGELWRPRRDWRHILTFHPDDAPRLHDSIKAHIEGGAPTYDVEFRIVVPGGGVRWFRQRGIALRDASGKAYRVVGSIGDVTEKHKAEEELSSLERELRLAQRLEAMGTLAGGIAHDFNNILGAILGYGEMAMRDAKKGTRLRRDVDSIMAAGERGRALVDRILAFSRSGVGERVPVHVEAVVREALDQVAASLPENVIIRPRLRAGRAAMLGDSTQVHQVVMNLANNAVQAMTHSGALRVSLDALRIKRPRAALIGTVSPGTYIVLKVADTGTGIRSEVLEHMFDPFFTTKEVGVGSGLGLSLVHGIVATVGGAINVATELGKGTTFTVYLPRSGDAPAEAADQARPLPRGEGERVLVVDDEEPLMRLATETLERLGYAPVGFTSSTAALAAFRADPGRFDAVLTDERMPGLSGSALIREVRGIRDAIPVILMSGYLAMESVDADVVVKKPLSARDLAASMVRALHP